MCFRITLKLLSKILLLKENLGRGQKQNKKQHFFIFFLNDVCQILRKCNLICRLNEDMLFRSFIPIFFI